MHYGLNYDNFSGHRLYHINKFKSYGKITERELVLKISPASMEVKVKMLSYSINSANYRTSFVYQLPVSGNSYYLPKDQKFIEAVEAGKAEVPRSSILEVSLYTGRVYLFGGPRGGTFNTCQYPYSHVDIEPEWGDVSDNDFVSWMNTKFKVKATESLCLTGSNSMVSDFQMNNIVDTSKEYNFRFPDSPFISSDNIFIINNQKYIPVSLEREKSQTQKTVKGKFYRMV